jgi:hypothetical protein
MARPACTSLAIAILLVLDSLAGCPTEEIAGEWPDVGVTAIRGQKRCTDSLLSSSLIHAAALPIFERSGKRGSMTRGDPTLSALQKNADLRVRAGDWPRRPRRPQRMQLTATNPNDLLVVAGRPGRFERSEETVLFIERSGSEE